MKNAVALGTFDGIHKGHIKVLSLPCSYNKIAVTFKKSPKAVISGRDESLCTFEDKCRILKSVGINEIYPLDFNEVQTIKAVDFLDLLYETHKPALISCGFNYRFGENGEGDVALLRDYCNKKGIELNCAEPVTQNGEVVSSTLIRNYLKNGEIYKANQLLFEPFSFGGVVKHGEQRGRTIGFPTINQQYPKELVKLKFGVYKVRVVTDTGEYLGIADIGIRPTYPLSEVISETFISDFDGNLYGKTVRIIPLEFLRDEMKFDSLDDLKKQIIRDINKLK